MPGEVSATKPDPKAVREFHTNADTDGSSKAIHHTLGPGAFQAAPGNHTHDGGNSSELNPWVPPTYTAPTFANSWTHYASGFNNMGYRALDDEVEFRGLIKHAVTTTVGAVWTMPVGMRPPNTVQFFCPASGGGFADVRIANTGVVSIAAYVGGGNGGSISFDHVKYSVTA